MRRRLLLWSLLAISPTPGCCSLARLFCGPDRSDWVSIDYTTAELAARTLLEALRRDEPEVVYRSLSHGYRDRLQLDQASAVLAWQKVREENPGLHVAGYAEVPPAVAIGADRKRIDLRVEGQRVELEVVRQRKWEVRWRRANGGLAEPGANLPSFDGSATLAENADGRTGALDLAPLVFRFGSDLPPLAAIEFAGLVAEWKIDRITMLVDG